MRRQRKGVRQLVSPHGRNIDSYLFGRSYQEVEKIKHKSVTKALDANDPDWRRRELILMPSHISDIANKSGPDDITQIIDAAHSAGFDVICASVVFSGSAEEDLSGYYPIWSRNWDERWTVPNPGNYQPAGQLDALGRDLWTWTCRAIAG